MVSLPRRRSGAVNRRSRLLDAVALGALLLAAPVVAWWAVGDLSTAEGPALDYAVRPASLSTTQVTLIGLLATLLLLVALAILLAPSSTLRRQRSSCGALLPLLGFVAFLGYAWRVLSAGVIGANIGAGLVLVLAGVLLVALIGGHIWWLRRTRACATTP